MSKLATLLKRGLRFRYLQENFKRVLRIFSRQLFLQDTFFTWRLILQCAKDLNQCTFSGVVSRKGRIRALFLQTQV